MEPVRTRREPPAFHRATVERRHDLGGRLTGLDLRLDDLDWLEGVEPAASVRLLLPAVPGGALEIPTWNGNEFLLADGQRPTIRTLTPLSGGAEPDILRLAVLRHDDSPLSIWLERCTVGDEVAVSGPGRGQHIDPAVDDWVLAGDESAIPAIITLLEVLPHSATVRVFVEVGSDAGDEADTGDESGAGGRPTLPEHPGATVDWASLAPGAPPGDTLVARVAAAPLSDSTLLWAAGEAAAMHRIRQQLDRGAAPRSSTVVRGYWKVNRPSRPAGSNSSTAP